MPKIFGSSVESSFFKFLSKIWDKLPQDDRDFLAEYWRGLIRGASDEYLNILQVEAATGILSINPFEVKKWRPIEVRKVLGFKDQDADGLVSVYPSGRTTPHHLDHGIARIEGLYRNLEALHFELDPPVPHAQVFDFSFDMRLTRLGPQGDAVAVGYYDGEGVRARASSVALVFGKIAGTEFVPVVTLVGSDTTVKVGFALPEVISPTGILAAGFAFSNQENLAVVAPRLLPSTTLEGGQAAVQVPEGSYGSVSLLLSTPPGPGDRLFHVYRSPTNFQDSYELLTTQGPVELTNVALGEYSLQFSTSGVPFNQGDWIKIRPLSLDAQFTFQSGAPPFMPLRVQQTTSKLSLTWAAASGSEAPGLWLVTSDTLGLYESLQAVKILEGTINPLDDLTTFHFEDFHTYRVDVGNGLIKVLIDGAEVLSQGFDHRSDREFGAFGIYSLEGAVGSLAFFRNTKFFRFNLDQRIAELPALYDKYEQATKVLEIGSNYTLEPGILRFNSLADVGIDDIMVAEYVGYSTRRIETTYGLLAGVTGPDSLEMKNRTIAIWNALWSGAQLESIRKGVQAFLGLPISLVEGFVTSDTSVDNFIDIDGVRYTFKEPVGPGVNPRTGKIFQRGDYVASMTALSSGVTVRDLVVQRGWWYQHQQDGNLHELQKYHYFEVEIDDRLVDPAIIIEVEAFLDRIRPIGDRFFVVARGDNLDTLVVEGNESRVALLDPTTGDPRRVFIGDSSDPAVVCTPYILTTPEPATLGYQMFGALTIQEVEGLFDLQEGQSLTGIEVGGFGDPDPAFLEFNLIQSGTGGATTAPLLFSDPTLAGPTTFTATGVRPGDVLTILLGPLFGNYQVSEVTSPTTLEINPTFRPFVTNGGPLLYEVTRPAVYNGAMSSFFPVGGYLVRPGATLVIKADYFPEVSVIVGIEPAVDPFLAPFVQPEDLVDALFFLNGESKIPGAIPKLQFLRVDTRDFPPFATPPRRLCIETAASKGMNSTILLTETNGSQDLQMAEGTYRGLFTYPGPDIEPLVGTEGGPFLESERLIVLPVDASGPGEPGLEFDAEIELDDGLTVRRDLQAVTDPPDPDVLLPEPYRVVGLLEVPGSQYNDLRTGQPYQVAIANGSQFGTFYLDYQFPRVEFPVAQGADGEVLIGSPNFVIPSLLAGTPAVFITGLGADTLAPNVVEDLLADFSSVRPGDTIEVGTPLVPRAIAQVLSSTKLLLADAPALELSQLGVPYTIRGTVVPGDWLFIEEFAGPVDRDILGIREGDVLVVTSVGSQFVTVSRILVNGSLEALVFGATVTGIQYRLLRAPLPYSANPQVPAVSRVSRVNLGYNLKADDIRSVEDAVDIEILLPCGPGEVAVMENTSYTLALGDVVRVSFEYDGQVVIPGQAAEGVGIGQGDVISASRFKSPVDWYNMGVRSVADVGATQGDYMDLVGLPANTGVFQILAIETTDQLNDTLVLAIGTLVIETGVSYTVVCL